MARRKTAAKTKSTTTKKKNGSAIKNTKNDDEKVKDNQKNKSVTITTLSKNNNSSGGGTTTIMDESNIKSTKLLKSTTTEKLQLHLLNNIDIKNMTNHNHNNNSKNYNNQQQKNNTTTTTATTTSSSTIIDSLYGTTTGPPLSSTQTTDNLIHRSSNNSISSTLLEPKNNNSNNLNNNIDKSNNNNREILISKINCQSTNNNNNHNTNDKYLHKKFKRPASVTVIENNNNNNYLNINSPIPITNSTTTNLTNEQNQNNQHHLSIDSIGGCNVSGIVSDGNCNNSNNNIGVKENIDDDNFKNPINNLISKSFTSSDKHLICENIINNNHNNNNSNYIGENGHDIIDNQKINNNCNNIDSDTEYQQKQNNNLISKINNSDLIINNKKPIINSLLSKSTTIVNENLIQKHNYLTTEKSIIIKKPKIKQHYIKGSLYSGPSENSSTPIDIQQQQQLNENLDFNYIGKQQSLKRLSTIKNLPSGSTDFHKQTNDIFKIVNNNNSNNINNKNIINSTISPTISNNMHNSTNFNVINNNQKLDKKDKDQQQQQQINSTTTTTPTPTILAGRHVCPYCNLNCTKPSVLQKHIRAHTNERPYPCDKCGIAFKTNSNYYKHCRSRSHLQRMKGVVDPQPNDDDGSLGSDQDPDLSNSSSDVISGTTSPLDERISSPAVQQLHHNQHYQHHHNQQNQLSSASSISSNSSTSSSIQKNSNDKPYKPKFHNAALYKDENIIATTTSIYRPRHNQPQPQPPQQQQQQSSLSPYSNKQNQMTNLSATSNLHNINNHISETLSSNYYSAQSQFIQQQQQQEQQQILHNHSTYIHPSGINHHEQQQKHHRSQISVNCESAMVVGSSTIPHHQQQHYTQQISSSAFQQSVAPVYNPETTGIITTIPLVVRDSTGSGSNFGGGSNSGGSLATATTGGGHQLNVEFLQEHISKLISQNQAIVENKEVLLQKKYPKQLNKQKSLSSLVIPTSSSIIETGGNSSSVTTPLNSKLHLALANKQQHQQQQQSHQHHHQQQLQLLFQQREEMLNRNSQNMNGFLTITNNTIPSPAPAPRPHCSTSNKNLTHQISEPSISLQQPLNLSKVSVVVDPTEIINSTPSPPLALTSVKQSSGCRKRSADDILLSSNSNTPAKTLATHPQNPERSIIKHLLLNARGLGIPNGEGDDAVYTCPLCKSDFQNAEELKHHTSHYCQGGPSSAPISPVASPSYKYFRSNSINVNLPEFNNPTSLATLAKSSLLHGKNPLPLAKLAFYRLKTKQSNLILNQLNVSTGNSTNNTTITSANIKNDNNNSETMQKLIDAPLPSPGPLLGKTQLVESYNPASNSDHKSEDVIITKVHEERNFPSTSNKEFYNAKKIKYDNQHISHNNYTPAHGQTFFGGGNMFESQSTQKTQFLMCNSGGDIQIIDKKDNNNVMKRFMSSGGCIEPISESITSPKFFRTPLLSGGSFTEIISQENQHSQQQQHHKKHETNHQLSIQQHIKPKMMIPITPLTPSLSSTPNILSAGRGLSLSGQHFQFPPINSITGFNPLTLPPINSISHSPVLPNGEKLIPYVPGIPGPNTLSLQLPPPPQRLIDFTSGSKRNSSPNRIKTTSPMVQESKTSDEQQNYHYRNSIQKYQQQTPIIRIENIEISCTTSSSILQMPQNDLIIGNSSNLRSVDELLPQQQMQRSPKIGSVWISNTHVEPQQQQPLHRKSFNFTRMADNISPKKPEKVNLIKSSIPVKEQARHFNFENLSTIKTEIKTEDLQPLHVDCPSSNVPLTTVPSSSSLSKSSLLEPLLPSLQQSPQNPDDKLLSTPSATTAKRTKFLRPTSLPLKPGTFTPKRHHGITPTANTMPLISPETPRPSKTCGQMFLNGHAYTYLGLKCSTKMFYCTVNCPQPSYVANLHKLSMYSVWQVQAEKNLHPLGLKPKTVMALYDSRQRNCTGFSMANIKLPYTSVHSQHTVMTPFENNTGQFYHHQIKSIPLPQITTTTLSGSHQEQTNIPNVVSSTNNSVVKDNQKGPILVGGYESNEDYTYIRGRGRGKYVCAECGIRCKKPSMLVKHIRTHSDIRPYTCSTCNFSFKTKGNLTKHMQSKAHYKRCLELGVDPGEGLNGEFVDNDQQSIISGNDRTSSIPGESDSEYGSDGDDRETESSDTDESKSRLPEHEAAHCLLSLSMTPPSNSVSPHYRSSSQVNYDNDKQQHQQTINSNNTSHRLDELKNQQQNINARRVISFTSPKPPFDYQKQEKYYSNPLVVPKNRPIEKFDENIMKPIDLTKPRCSTQQQLPIVQQLLESSNTTKQLTVGNLNDNNSKITDVIGNLSNESVFHKSLLSITDKIRIGGNNNTDSIEFTGQQHHHPQKQNDDILFQAYLTEQALQYTKIKQSQMSSSKSFNSDDMIKTTNIGLIVTTTTTATTSILAGNLNNYNKIMKKDNINSKSPNLTTITDTTITTQSSNSLIVSTTSSNLTNKLLSGDKLENNENDSILLTDQSSIKEVALDMPRITDSPIIPIINEILTDSNSKLNNINTNTKDVNESNIKLTNENSQLIRTSSISKQKDNAKSVASEYLKITQKTNTNSNNNSVKLQNDETNPDDEDSSDQEIPLSSTTINTTNTTTTTTDTSNLKPSNDFSGILARTVIVGEDGFKNSTTPTDNQKLFNRVQISDDNGRPICTICSKTFQKQHQLVLHMNIHYMERKFKCEPCAVSFRTQGHLQKHERSEAHKNKVMMTSTFGVPTTSNPRPYECADCKVAFRIHGHLAKHLRSKTHVQKLECSQKLPFGTYAEIERAGISLTEIDTTDCDNSLASLKILAQKLFEKDPSKLSAYTKPSGMEINSNILDNNCESGSEDNPDCLDDIQQQQGIPVPITISSTNLINDDNNITENRINNVGTIGGGIKRKFDSFSSCSNDSQSGAITGDNRLNITTTIATSQEGNNNNNSSIVGGDEKRLRSTNLTK